MPKITAPKLKSSMQRATSDTRLYTSTTPTPSTTHTPASQPLHITHSTNQSDISTKTATDSPTPNRTTVGQDSLKNYPNSYGITLSFQPQTSTIQDSTNTDLTTDNNCTHTQTATMQNNTTQDNIIQTESHHHTYNTQTHTQAKTPTHSNTTDQSQTSSTNTISPMILSQSPWSKIQDAPATTNNTDTPPTITNTTDTPAMTNNTDTPAINNNTDTPAIPSKTQRAFHLAHKTNQSSTSFNLPFIRYATQCNTTGLPDIHHTTNSGLHSRHTGGMGIYIIGYH